MGAILTAIKRGFGVAAKNLGLVLILIVFNVIGSLVSMPFAVTPGQTPTPQMTASRSRGLGGGGLSGLGVGLSTSSVSVFFSPGARETRFVASR